MLIFCRGFNDAVNGFNDDGWSVINCGDGSEDVVIAINSTKSLSNSSNLVNSLSFLGGILCAKASMLLQVSSSLVVIQLNLFDTIGFIRSPGELSSLA